MAKGADTVVIAARGAAALIGMGVAPVARLGGLAVLLGSGEDMRKVGEALRFSG